MKVNLALPLAVLLPLLSPQAPAPVPLPDPLQAGWKGVPVCERLLEDSRQRVLRCTFPPGVGHERHFHRAYTGYALSGGRMRTTDAQGSRETTLPTGSVFANPGIAWHEALNVGEATVQYLLVESKAPLIAATLDPELVGAWDLVSLQTHWPEGKVSRPWGDHPKGRLTYGADGAMSIVMMHQERNVAGGGSVLPDLADEQAGYFGTYSVDAETHRVFHHVAASLRSSESGTIERAYAFRDGGLVFTVRGKGDGATVLTYQTWKRAEPASSAPAARD